MRDTSSVDLVNIAKYGEEYRNEKDISINVLFHGYGHYDILETFRPKLSENKHLEVGCSTNLTCLDHAV